METGNQKQIISVKCITQPINLNTTEYTHSLVRRDVLPAGFSEPEYEQHSRSFFKSMNY